MLPEDDRPSMAQCSTYILSHHMEATYGLCLGSSGEFLFSQTMLRQAPCMLGGGSLQVTSQYNTINMCSNKNWSSHSPSLCLIFCHGWSRPVPRDQGAHMQV